MAGKSFKRLSSGRMLKSEFIGREILRHILSGDYVPGDVLPSETALCETFGVSRNTVRQAFENLTHEGVVYRIRGKGTYVAKLTSANKSVGTLNIFCLILPEVDRDLYPVLINGFSEGATLIHRQVMLSTTSNDVYRQGGILLQILDTHMGGVAIVPMLDQTTPPQHMWQLQTNNIPVVLCNRRIEGVRAPLASWDWEEVGRVAARHFLSRGHRRMGYFSTVDHPSAQLHIRGMQDILAGHGCTLRQQHILFASLGDSDEHKRDTIQTMLSAPDRPTAVFCVDDTEAEVVYWAAEGMGLKVPDDVAIMGFGVSKRKGVFRKRLTSVTIDGFELGRKVVNLLAEMQTGIRSITDTDVFHTPLDLIEGETT